MSNKTLHNILYAEDESDIREVAQVALEDVGGFAVTYCCNGYDLLEKSINVKPDLIILDVMMPGLDGPATLLELRKIAYYESLPVIFMTAKIQPDEISRYKSLGAIDVITKPFDPMTLSETINRIWQRYCESCQMMK